MTTTPPDKHAETLLTRIKDDVYRLTVTTPAPIRALAASAGDRRRRAVTRVPLLTEIRDAIRPDQGGTDSGRGASGSRLPFDSSAMELSREIESQIAYAYSAATDLNPIGSAEQLLLEWFHEFDHAHRRGEINTAQLQTAADRISRWRRRIEDHFDPPREREYPLCPSCGYTHHLTPLDGEYVLQRCLLAVAWLDNPNREPQAECRYCGAKWVGRTEMGQLNDDIDEHIKEYGDKETWTAPLEERTPEEPLTEGAPE